MTQDLTGIEWRYSEWLMANGGINLNNVMEYFSLSPFWDPTSNNAVLKMQTNFNAFQDTKEQLKKMIGIEFEIIKEHSPQLFIIRKQKRDQFGQVIPISIYYVLNGNIYQAPNLYNVLANRMLTMINHLSHAFKETYKFVEFHPSGTYRWKVDPPREEENKEEAVETQKAIDYQSSIDRVFMADGMESTLSKNIPGPKENTKLKKYLAAKQLLQKISEEKKALKIKSRTSTPSNSAEGGKSKRKSDGSGKKKKRSKRSTPAL